MLQNGSLQWQSTDSNRCYITLERFNKKRNYGIVCFSSEGISEVDLGAT